MVRIRFCHIPSGHRPRLLRASAIALLAAMPVQAQDIADCTLIDGVLPETCEQGDRGVVVTTPVAPNQDDPADDRPPRGFSISVDGETIAGEEREVIAGTESGAGADRARDIALDAADVQVKVDGIGPSRQLNVATADLRTEFRAGETVTFRSSTNYPGAIARAEIRLREMTARGTGGETVVVPIAPEGMAEWRVPEGEEGDYAFVLRVYDAQGRFDETAPAYVSRRERPVLPELNGPVVAAGEGEDRTARRNIPVSGGMVTVSGRDLPPGTRVSVMGQPVPVDAAGAFVTQVALPAGEQDVTVALSAPGADSVTLVREVEVPRDDWFATGLADFTFGQRGASLSDGESYSYGRLSFYVDGVTGGQTRVTAAFDSGEEEFGDLFDDVLTKDPRAVLKRIDPDDLYPTYGDDSTITENAPTSGKLYLRIARGDSHIMWGDFEGRIDSGGYLDASRDLYGAQAVYRSPGSTEDGERRLTFSAYAAQPDSLPQRDELRGTGGSVYFLKRQDIVRGSETVSVEIVDPVTGRVVARETLTAADDYRIDYFQGTIILDEPLASSRSGGGAIGGDTGDYDLNLVVQYEYAPALGDPDGEAFGGRLETWLPGERVRLGFTAMDETTDAGDISAVSADVRFRFGTESYVEAEIAESRGTGFGRSVSTDGGLTFTDIGGSGGTGPARAGRIEGRFAFSDIAPGTSGEASFYAERKEAGFVTLSEDVAADEMLWGFALEGDVSDRLAVAASYDDYDSDNGNDKRKGEIGLTYRINPDLTLELALAHLDQTDAGDPDDTGRRTDIGFRLTRELAADQSLYLFGQGTVDRSGTIRRNDRLGVGGVFNLSDRVTLEAEVSGGTGGAGGRALVDYRPTDTSRYYLGYELDQDREIDGVALDGQDRGSVIVGAESTVSPSLRYFAENDYDMFGRHRALTSAYGVTYTPLRAWEYSASLELGRVNDDVNGDFDRTALSLGVRYDDGAGQNGSLRLEYRTDDHETDGARDRDSYAVVGSYGYQVNPDWRFVASLDALYSNSDQTDLLDGRYVEASLGYAYRPVANDRLNLLARYTFLYDLPGVDQVTSDGTTAGAKQRSHILSLDAIYELDANWELGGKLAYRKGETAPRDSDVFTGNDAGLAAIRATYSVDQLWEVSGELRVLVLPDADSRETGALLTVYRSFGNNAKIGVGYNFGSFSDDLRDTTLDDEGIFLNVQAKF